MPDWRAEVRSRMPRLKSGPARESEIVAEIALQMEQAYADALARGASEAEAAHLARQQFPDWTALAAEINTEERPRIFHGGWQDIRYGARFLRRNPAFAAVAVATLAFGIGGNTAIFTLVDALALRGLPYRDAHQLMAIETRKVQQPELEPWTSALDFFDYRDRNRAFSAVAAISPVWDLVFTGRGETEKLSALYVSSSFFPMLGVQPAIGRVFRPDEDRRTRGADVIVLGYGLWQRRFAGDPSILGQRIALDNGTYTVVGVMPASFRYEGEPLAGTATDIDVYAPLAGNMLANSIRGLRFLKVIGRRAAGVSVEQARDEARRAGAALAEQYPDSDRGFAIDVRPLREQVTGPLRVTTWLLLGSIGFVLLMACANVANLLLARAAAREREIAVRIALGASRWRLMRQLLTEGLVMAAAGGALGLLLARGGLSLLLAIAPETLAHGRTIALDWRAIAFTTGAALASALLAGLPPAWRMVRSDVEASLRETGRSLLGGRHRLRAALVAAQVAAALTLLVGSGLLLHSFRRLLDVNPGFDPHNLATIATLLPPAAGTPPQRIAMYRLIHERLLAVPGIQSVGAVSRLPLAGRNLGSWMFIEGRPVTGEPGLDVEYRVATPDYFETMRIPLRAGRAFDDRDEANPASVLLINETAARRFWPGENPVGKRVKLGATPDRLPWITVIGVVGDLRHSGLDVEPRPEVYRPYAVNPLGAPVLVIRAASDPAPLLNALSAAVRSVNAGVAAYNVSPMQALVDRSTGQRRFVMWLLSAFAAAALLLAAVGIYGTVSQAVAQRTQEIGLRMALGAAPAEALAMVFRQGMRPVATGIVLGTAGSVGIALLIRGMLFEVRPLDPAAFAMAAGALAAAAMLACYIPARRATRVDPLTALRQE
jgi:putative ABC transport system permease protein